MTSNFNLLIFAILFRKVSSLVFPLQLPLGKHLLTAGPSIVYPGLQRYLTHSPAQLVPWTSTAFSELPGWPQLATTRELGQNGMGNSISQLKQHMMSRITINQQKINLRDWIPHISLIPEVISLKLYLDMVTSSSTDVTCALRQCLSGGLVNVSFCLVSIHWFKLRETLKKNLRPCYVSKHFETWTGV